MAETKQNKQSPSHKEHRGSDGFTNKIYQIITDQINLILHKIFQVTGKNGNTPYSFYELILTLILKTDMDSTNKEN